jgi:hypothetical protein
MNDYLVRSVSPFSYSVIVAEKHHLGLLLLLLHLHSPPRPEQIGTSPSHSKIQFCSFSNWSFTLKDTVLLIFQLVIHTQRYSSAHFPTAGTTTISRSHYILQSGKRELGASSFFVKRITISRSRPCFVLTVF